MISVHSPLHYLVSLFFLQKKKTGPHASKIKTNGYPHGVFSCSAGWNCLRTLSGSIRGGACSRRPSMHCAQLMPSVLYWRQWEDDLSYSRAARRPRPSRFLIWGQHTPGKTIGEEQEKGYLVQHKFHSVCSHLPSLGGENKGPKENYACEDSPRHT